MRVTGWETGDRSRWFLIAACATVAALVAVGIKVTAPRGLPAGAAVRSWHGNVADVVRSGPASSGSVRSGLTMETLHGKQPAIAGTEIGAGTRLFTDAQTRARLSLDDGSVVILDRSTDVVIGSTPRALVMNEGAVLADIAHVEGAPLASFKTPNGEVKVLGTKFALMAMADRTNVEVLRGAVEVTASNETRTVSAGQEGVVGRNGMVDVAPANDLGERAAFGEALVSPSAEDVDVASGLGELRAKRPGRVDEKDHAVRLQNHAVKVRIAGNVARTEIDETFANDTDDELEGIYRFPLPSGAQIERLALEVDGKLLDGEFIDQARASAIWRGAIQNAAPKAPKPKEEIVWVPGPWHDPALLEWQQGGRFELRIFPIPKRGSRRVVIAYTEVVAPASGARRYVYPLPQGSSSKIVIDRFTVDAQVLGHDAGAAVRTHGYDLERKTEAGATRLFATMSAFTPSGDLAIEYGLGDNATDMTAWAYRTETPRDVDVKGTKGTDPIGADPFVAIALRPKLPGWSESKPRDQVIVVDAGRAMFGERFARAKRLAVTLTQEMDRRDRVSVIACDVSCRVLPGGFVSPGAPSAHDVDAFLDGITPDGASDLVGAVRSASKMIDRSLAREARISVLSVGRATAGYRSAGRVAAEIADAVSDARAVVVAVPIGFDADVDLLADIARGGGGVVVPYSPGQPVGTTAVDVLGATYGTMLRDVHVVLPEGLRDLAPANVAPLRAGSETIVTARMSRDSVKGDVIVRGKVGGEAFEATYPLDVRATADEGNAFVPRLFAAARIAELQRQPGTSANAELVALSRRFSVPSKMTSLLVLESEAMFNAFGIARADHVPTWTGEALARGSVAAAPRDEMDPYDALSPSSFKADRSSLAAATKGADSEASFGGIGSAWGAPNEQNKSLAEAVPPAPTNAPSPAMLPPASRASVSGRPLHVRPLDDEPRRRAPPGGRFMKRIFVRRATLGTDVSTSALSKVAPAREAVAAAPDERSKHKDLARILSLAGEIDELSTVLEKWSSRDPFDGDVIVGRADVADRRGDREGALRILGGALAASALATNDAFAVAQAVGRSYDRLGKSEACAFHVAAAELKSTNAQALARAVSCEKEQGRGTSAQRWFVGLTDAQRTSVNASLAQLEAQRTESAVGDIVVAATWSGGVDLDIALIDPAGRRAGVVTRTNGVRVEGATARDHETVALTSKDVGGFLVEIVRTKAHEAALPVKGVVTVKAFGTTRSFPFSMTGPRVSVARVDVHWAPELVSLDRPPTNFSGFEPFVR